MFLFPGGTRLRTCAYGCYALDRLKHKNNKVISATAIADYCLDIINSNDLTLDSDSSIKPTTGIILFTYILSPISTSVLAIRD